MEIEVRCDRCGNSFKGTKTENMTGGYYDLGSKYWKDLAEGKEHEFVICDNCMFASPKYIAAYAPNK